MDDGIKRVLDGAARWTVLCANNAEILPTLPDRSVAHVITDPPYSEHVHGKARRGASSWSDAGEFQACISRASELGFPSLTAEQRAFCAEQFARISRRWTLAFCDLEMVGDWMRDNAAAGLQHVRVGLWQKLNATPQFTGDRPASAAEAIVISHPKGRKKWNGGGTHALWTHAIEMNRGGDNARLHTTQKPLPLMLELVELFTDPDDIVLDPFAGSGTTGVACLRLGRRFIGIEKDAKYAAIARERLEAEQDGLSLKDKRAGQLPMFGGAT